MADKDSTQPNGEAKTNPVNGSPQAAPGNDREGILPFLSFSDSVNATSPRSPEVSPETMHERNEREILTAVQRLIQDYKAAAAKPERRREDRIDFIQSVQVVTEDGRRLTLLSRDLSVNGICLIASVSLLGQKIRVYFPPNSKQLSSSFVVRVVWTCTAGDNLFENGCAFLQALGAENISAPH